MWSPQTEALCDIPIIDTDAPSYKHRTPEAVFESAAKEKKRIYQKAVEERRVNSHPLLFQWMDSCTERQTMHFMKRIAASLARNGRSLIQKQLVLSEREAIFCNLEIC